MAQQSAKFSDATLSFGGGQNAGLIPTQIDPDQYEKGINIITNKGVASARPPFIHQDITVVTVGKVYDRTYQEIFKTGKVQGFSPFSGLIGNVIIIVISGIIFSYNYNDNKVSVLKLPNNDRLNQYTRKINISQAGRFLVLYDYPNRPVIIDPTGKGHRSSTKDYEVPVSVNGAYNSNRLFIADDGVDFGASDPVGNKLTPDAPVTFVESLAPAQAFTGDFYSLGTANPSSRIVAMGFLQVTDESLLNGPLFLATNDSIYLAKTNQPRENWASGWITQKDSSGFTTLFLPTGMAGAKSFVNVNSDLFFMSPNGDIYSVFTARDRNKGAWDNAPISNEVNNWLKGFDPSLRSLSSMAFFQNRVLTTVGPYRTVAKDLFNNDVVDFTHKGIISLNNDNISFIRKRPAPAWDGLWTGINPIDICTIGNRCFVIAKDADSFNSIYEIGKVKGYDVLSKNQIKQIKSRVYTRAYTGQALTREGGLASVTDKKVLAVEYSVLNIAGDFKFKAYQKPIYYPYWASYPLFQHIADTMNCNKTCLADTLLSHGFNTINLGNPDIRKCDPVTREVQEAFRNLQLLIEIEGLDWSLLDIYLEFIDGQKSRVITSDCRINTVTQIPKDCSLKSDWTFYSLQR